MSDSNNDAKNNVVRVEAFQPRARLWGALAVVLVTIVIGMGVRAYVKRGEAAPMSGDCKDVPVKRYEGGSDRDGQTCLWKGRTYWCTFERALGSIWVCAVVEPPPLGPPAEKHQ